MSWLQSVVIGAGLVVAAIWVALMVVLIIARIVDWAKS